MKLTKIYRKKNSWNSYAKWFNSVKRANFPPTTSRLLSLKHMGVTATEMQLQMDAFKKQCATFKATEAMLLVKVRNDSRSIIPGSFKSPWMRSA